MSRYNDLKNSAKTLKEIDVNKKDYLIIHYSCESFYDKTDGYSPRITSIAIRNFATFQTELFAIHKIAEIKKIPFNEITNHYDDLEKEMLKRYFKFVDRNKSKKWLHWNMRDSNYGFKAISHRAEVLGVKSEDIDDDKKIDIASLFIQRYGKGYAKNPRIENLLKINHISPKDFLPGKDEAAAFENQEYIKLGMSTASKVDVFSNFLNLAIDNKLIVNSTKFEIYGCTIKGFIAMIQDNMLYTGIFYIANLVLGGFIGAWISNTFFGV